MARKYHTLLVRDNAGEPWGAAFGDYDRDAVNDARDEATHFEYRRSDTRIITTGETQDEITAAVARLNKR